ncbi:alpha/beta fold hydrolase [Chryseosolibacter indicus]|nr:alpha/beta hydrolase [Chryseosolibacter indicus]
MKVFFTIIIMFGIMDTVTAQSKGNYADVNGLKMYYEIHGEGFPLVLIHGGGSNINTTFGRILPSLAKTNKVIAVEMQAHGHTADIDRPLTFEQDADDIAALLKQLNIAKANILGFSNGASTTLELAIRHPQVVNRIIVASTMYKKGGAQPWFWDMMANATFEGMPQIYKDAFIKINPDKDALYNMYKRDVARMQSFKDIREEDIKGIQAPTLIIIGDNDVVTPEHAVEMYRQIEHARLMIYPGGHGDYLGEITTIKPGQKDYAALPVIEAFLKEN